MKPIAIVACCCFAVGLWSSCSATATTTTASDVTTSATTRQDRKLEVTAVESSAPSLDEMMRLAEVGGQFVSNWIGSIVSDPSTDDGPAVEGRGKKMKPGAMAMAMSAAAGMSMMMAKSMGAIMLFIVHSFFVTKLGIIIGAYLLLCKMMEMQKQPPKKVIKWTSPPDDHPPHMMMSAGGPYPESQSPYGGGDPLQQQQQPGDQYGAPPQQQPGDQYGAPPPQQQYMAPADFGGGGDIMQAHYSNVSPVTYRPAIKADNVAKSVKTGRIIRRRR